MLFLAVVNVNRDVGVVAWRDTFHNAVAHHFAATIHPCPKPPMVFLELLIVE